MLLERLGALNPKSPLGLRLHARMLELNISLAQLAKGVDVVYETIRKTVGGTQLPSKRLLRSIAEHLGMDFEQLDTLRVAQQLHSKFGDAASRSIQKNPELREIDQFWDFLTTEQKQHVTWLVRSFADQNARPAVSVAPLAPARTLGLIARSASSKPAEVQRPDPAKVAARANRSTSKKAKQSATESNS